MTMINLYPVIAEKLHIPVGKEFKLKLKRGGAYPAQYRFSADAYFSGFAAWRCGGD